MAAIDQANPMPKKTLTALEPVMWPIEASAVTSCMAAWRLANVSGKPIPIAISVTAVTVSRKPTVQLSMANFFIIIIPGHTRSRSRSKGQRVPHP